MIYPNFLVHLVFSGFLMIFPFKLAKFKITILMQVEKFKKFNYYLFIFILHLILNMDDGRVYQLHDQSFFLAIILMMEIKPHMYYSQVLASLPCILRCSWWDLVEKSWGVLRKYPGVLPFYTNFDQVKTIAIFVPFYSFLLFSTLSDFFTIVHLAAGGLNKTLKTPFPHFIR